MGVGGNAPRPQPGDRVRLKSGGAVMTVERANHAVGRPYVQCSWMDAREKTHWAFHTIAALDLVEPEPKQEPKPVW